jgi:CTP synthase (UTP-ammonia lyase)
VPYFGICFGMQMAVIEAARNLAGISKAQVRRVRRPCKTMVVGLMTEWMKGNQLEKRSARRRSRRHDAPRRLPAFSSPAARWRRNLRRGPRSANATATATK